MTNIRISDKESYVSFLETIDWDFWVTGTTNYSLTLPSARRLMERFSNNMKRFNGTLFRDELKIWWVAEPFDLRYGYHIHFLMEAKPEPRFKEIYSLWNYACKKSLGHHRISAEKFKKGKGAGKYCAKYIMKRNADYDLLI
jgi:hypothetical protein